MNKLDAADTLLAHRPDERDLGFARALLLEAKGDKDRALAGFDRLATDPDQLTRARAATRAVELRLATGAFDARQAADALDRQLLAWRGDRREPALRLRVADLRAQSGSWREALALLRETETLWPDDQPAIHARLKATFAAFLNAQDADRQSPFDLVALIDENPDLLPAGEQDPEMAARLADRLLALDLPKRAAPVMEKLVQSAAGAARAGFGARLAALRLREGDADGALAALSASASDPLPPAIEQQRALVKARAIARRGDPAAAAALLADVGTAEADEARAAILEDAKDWPQAERALADYAGADDPARWIPQRHAAAHLAAACRGDGAGRRSGGARRAARARDQADGGWPARRHVPHADRRAGAGRRGPCARGEGNRTRPERSDGSEGDGAGAAAAVTSGPAAPAHLAPCTRSWPSGRVAAMRNSAGARGVSTCADPPVSPCSALLGPRGFAHVRAFPTGRLLVGG